MSDEISLSNWPQSRVREEAERGNADAQLELGNRYFNGTGVEPNSPEAAKWFRKSAEQGNAVAQLFLGRCYYIRGDDDKAAYWYRRAAEQGEAGAQTLLGICYKDGCGVEQNDVEAVRWIKEAINQGSDDALKYAEEHPDLFFSN